MNKKGQALVEFIIVLPIFILTILAVFDIVNIYQTKISLEENLDNLLLDENYEIDSNIKVEETTKEEKTTYILSKEVEVSSPFVSVVTSSPYKVVISRTVYEK